MLFATKTVKQVNDNSTIIAISVYLNSIQLIRPKFWTYVSCSCVYQNIPRSFFPRIKNEVILPIEVKLYPSKTKVLFISPSTSSAFAVTNRPKYFYKGRLVINTQAHIDMYQDNVYPNQLEALWFGCVYLFLWLQLKPLWTVWNSRGKHTKSNPRWSNQKGSYEMLYDCRRCRYVPAW